MTTGIGTSARERVIVALDGMSESDAMALAERLSGSVWGFKVNDLLLHCGVPIVEKLKAYGGVFADPKLHDIPNTVKNGVSRLVSAGADILTIHASGGTAMIQAAMAARGSASGSASALTGIVNASERPSGDHVNVSGPSNTCASRAVWPLSIHRTRMSVPVSVDWR